MSCSDCCVVFSSPKWIEENKNDFIPPVCNKCMFSEQLKVFFVGGPNNRKDYHLEEGEELFYQIEGDMILKIIENGQNKIIKIKQGEIFLLPSKIEHSPQRFENTIGCVIERTRDNEEYDCIRYFVDNSTNNILYERWFHLNDVVKDIPPIIQEFNQSDEAKTQKPGPNSKLQNPVYEPANRKVPDPIKLNDFIDSNLELINSGPFQLYGAPEYKSFVHLCGKGNHTIETGNGELIVMPQRGQAKLICNGQSYQISAFDMCRVKENQKIDLIVDDESVVIIVKMTRN